MEKMISLTTSLLDKAAAALFAAALAINFANIIGRYLLHAPLFWAEEVTTLLVIWSICLLSFRLTIKGEHLVTDILRPYLPASLQRALLIICSAFVLVVALYLAWQAYLVVDMVSRFEQVTTVAELPKSMANGAILLAFVLAAAGTTLRLLYLLNPANPLPSTDPVEVAELVGKPEAGK